MPGRQEHRPEYQEGASACAEMDEPRSLRSLSPPSEQGSRAPKQPWLSLSPCPGLSRVCVWRGWVELGWQKGVEVRSRAHKQKYGDTKPHRNGDDRKHGQTRDTTTNREEGHNVKLEENGKRRNQNRNQNKKADLKRQREKNVDTHALL